MKIGQRFVYERLTYEITRIEPQYCQLHGELIGTSVGARKVKQKRLSHTTCMFTEASLKDKGVVYYDKESQD